MTNRTQEIEAPPTGRALYMAYLNDQPATDTDRLPTWCELDDIEQAAWSAKAQEKSE